MEKHQTPGSPITPNIDFETASGKLEITGRSIPENPIEFYTPLIDAIDAYALAPKALTEVTLRLEYYNSSSSKCLLDILKKFEKIASQGHAVKINWLYDEHDEGILHAGEDYKVMLNIPFALIPITE